MTKNCKHPEATSRRKNEKLLGYKCLDCNKNLPINAFQKRKTPIIKQSTTKQDKYLEKFIKQIRASNNFEATILECLNKAYTDGFEDGFNAEENHLLNN